MGDLTLFEWTRRRIRKTAESMSCFHFMSLFLFANFGMLFFFVFLLFTPFFYIPLAYGVWLYLDRETPHKGGRRSQWVRKLPIWRWMANYFPVKLHKTVELDPSNNYIFGFHPHGIFGIGGFLNFGTESTDFEHVFPGITCHFLILDGHFLFPVYRDYVMCSGAGAVNPKSVQYKLTKLGPGHSVWIAVGGAAEAFLSTSTAYKLKINSRKGFVKIALRTGAHLVPVFSFGETTVFDQVRPPEGSVLFRIQEAMRRILGFAPVVFQGRFMLMPFRKPINTVVGAPIEVPHIENPSEEDINRWHATYLEELRKLYNENKNKFGDSEKELIFC